MSNGGSSFLARGLRHLVGVWSGISSAYSGGLASFPAGPALSARDKAQLLARMRECVEGVGGEVSARARAARLGQTYLALNREGRATFLQLVAHAFGPEPAALSAAARAYLDAPDDAARLAAEAALRRGARAPGLDILGQFTTLPDGVKFLVDLRAELMDLARGDPALEALDEGLQDLLSTWFDVGFLELRRITWESPAAVLEKLIAYEAVHEISSWDDLRNRLDSDRRLYAFFHPRMPAEPLIFVEVALTRDLADNVQALLELASAPLDPARADTAIFYSISNTQRGLRGVSFGSFLLKRVIDDLKRDLPQLRTFATLSPIPGFGRWLAARIKAGEALLGESEEKRLKATGLDLAGLLAHPDWPAERKLAAALRDPLTRLAARYLLREQKDARPLDPVARFHLGNGARAERLNWLADTSPRGMGQSHGLMVNYLYALSELEDNHERYARQGELAASAALRRLARDLAGGHAPPMADWGRLLALSLIWGHTFLLIKLAVDGLPPATVVFARLLIAALVLGAVLAASGRRLPPPGRVWLRYMSLALLGNVAPFLLITWGQQWLESGLTGILMAMMPLATLVLAHFLVPGERLGPARAAGFLLGFAGVLVLVGPEALAGMAGAGERLVAELAVLAGTLCYAVNSILARRSSGGDLTVTSTGVLACATLLSLPVALAEAPWTARPDAAALAATLALGLFPTALATLLYFRVIADRGPTFLSQINYLIPLVAVASGAAFLGEDPGPEAWTALALILAGIALARTPPKPVA